MKALILVVVIISVVLFMILASSFISMILWNFLAGYFGFKKVSFLVAFVITVAIAFISSAFKSK